VRPEAYHVTLRFLGSIDPEVVPRLVESVSRETGEISPFELAIGAVHLFPNSRHPRVVALDLHPEAPLRALAEGVERAVVEAGFPPEGRSFRAHLTLGRVRGPKAPDALPEAVPSVPPFPVREVILFRSDLQPTGAVYVPLERMALGARISPGTRTSKGEPYGEE
jgi:2'-5' RNA ligase